MQEIRAGNGLWQEYVDSLRSGNFCRSVFRYFLSVTLLAIFAGTLNACRILNTGWIWFLVVILMLPISYLSCKIYDRWVRWSLLGRNWDENNFWRGLQLLAVLWLLLWIFPTALLSIIWWFLR